MAQYLVEVRITPREGLLDPQGRAVETALHSLGFPEASGVRIGKLVRMAVEAESEAAALDRVRAMCAELIANPVTEDYDVRAIDVGAVAVPPGT